MYFAFYSVLPDFKMPQVLAVVVKSKLTTIVRLRRPQLFIHELEPAMNVNVSIEKILLY